MGIFSQYDGDHTVSGSLHVADCQGGVGKFFLHAGSLIAGELDLAEGSNTLGEFNQDGGHSIFSNGLKIARSKSTAHGIYQLLQGTLTTIGPEYIGESGAGEFYQYGGTHHWLVTPAEMYIGYNTTATGKYAISGGNLYAGSGKIYVGYTGHGTLEIGGTGLVIADELVLGSNGTLTSTGGTLRVNKLTGFGSSPNFGCSLQIGHAGGLGQGSYSLASGQSLTTHDLTVGCDAAGTFSQNGGANLVGNYLIQGDQAGGQGTYTMGSTGFVSVSSTYQRIGSHGSGTFTHNNGNNTVGANLYLGQFANSQGTYKFNSGNLTAHDLIVGCQGTGTMSQTAGAATVASCVILGEQAGGQGSYTLGGTGSVSAPYQRIGVNGTGTFTQNAGGNTVSLNMYVGESVGSHGIYNLNGGSLSVGEMNIGLGDTGEFNWNGGSLSAGSVWIYSHGAMTCGQNWTYDKMLEVRGGSLDLSGHAFTLQSFSPAPTAHGEMTDGHILVTDAYIGSVGQATFTQSDGNFGVTDSLFVSAGPAASGQFTLAGGTLTSDWQHIAYQGAGSMRQTGGTNRVFSDLSLGRASGGYGAYEMNGVSALLTANNVRVGNGGNGYFTHSLGNVSVTGILSLGFEATGSGFYDLGAGSLQAYGEPIGVYGFGTFTQRGGANTIGGGGLTLGNQSLSMGRYELSGGMLTVAGPTIIQGRGVRGDHRIVQTGGQAHYDGGLVISDQSWGGSSRYELRGGRAWVADDLVCNAQGHILLGGTMGVMAISNTLLINGGSLDVELTADNAVSWLAVNGTGAGAVNLVNPLLTLSLATGYTPGASAQTWTLIDLTDANATIANTFAGLPEGASLTFGGRTFLVSYMGGLQHNDLVLTAAALPSADAVWLGLSDNSWGNPSNWNPNNGVPNWTGTTVTFGEPRSNPLVDLQGTDSTVGLLKFNRSVSTTIQGTGTLTLDNNTADVSISVYGSHLILTPLKLKSNLAVTVDEAAGVLEIGEAITDNGNKYGMTKRGNGLLVLRGNNTYSGITTVLAGTLKLAGAGSISGSSVDVANGAVFDVSTAVGGYQLSTGKTLQGSGTIVGDLLIDSGATHSPGNSPGIQTVQGSYTMHGLLHIELQGSVAGRSYDQVLISDTVARDVALGGLLSLVWGGGNWSSDSDKLWILSNETDGTLDGMFSNYAANGMWVGNYDGRDWQIFYGADSVTGLTAGGNDVLLVTVPEPSSVALLGVAIMGLLGFAWRRKAGHRQLRQFLSSRSS